MTFNKRMISSGRGDWETDPEFFAMLDDIFHFQVDVCANERNHKCETWIGEKQDGLKADWKRPIPYHNGFERGWMNPVYSNAMAWVTKASEQFARSFQTVGLLPARTDPEWFQGPLQAANAILFLNKRLKFYLPCIFCGERTMLLRKPASTLKLFLPELLPGWSMESYPLCEDCAQSVVIPEWDRYRPMGWDFHRPANSPSFPSMLALWIKPGVYDVWRLKGLGVMYFPQGVVTRAWDGGLSRRLI